MWYNYAFCTILYVFYTELQEEMENLNCFIALKKYPESAVRTLPAKNTTG
jgi:hypothetical protein